MAKKSGCCCSTETKTILACSGASNVGQIANDVARELARSGEAHFFCLAGVGGRIPGMIESVKGADKVLVLDGCPVACGKKTMDAAGLTSYEHLMVTDFRIEKNHEFRLSRADLAKARAAVRQKLGKQE